MENTIEQEAEILAKKIWDKHFEGWVYAGQIRTNAINAILEFATSQISHHLDKLTEEIKEGAEIKNYYNFNSHVDKESITKITAEYKLKNKLT